MVGALIQIAQYLLSIVSLVIIVQVVLSWLFVFNVLNMNSHGVRAFALAIDRLTAPLYRPIRRMLPDFGGIDFSPLVVLIAVQVLQKLLGGVYNQYYFGG